MKACRLSFVMLVLTWLGQSIALPPVVQNAGEKPIKVTLSALQKDKQRFDGKVVTLAGEAQDFKQKTSRAGNRYFTLRVKSGEDSVNVYSRGEYPKEIKDDSKLEITGVYRVEKKLGSLTFKNEIDCTKAEGKPYGIKEIQ